MIKENIWMCTLISTIIAILTFVLNFIIKKRKNSSNNTQIINNISSSDINQAGGNIKLTKDVK